MTIHLLVTDEDLAVQGDPLADWLSLDCTRRFNEPGSGSVDLPAHPETMAQLVEGNRLLVMRDGAVWMSGPMEINPEYSWGIGEEAEPEPGMVTVSFTDDLARPAGYKTWPDPTLTWDSQPDGPYTVASGNAEAIIRGLVNLNCGPGALIARRIPHLALGALAAVGSTTTVNTRLEGLLETCRRVAVDGGGLGFRVREVAGQLLFEVYAPQDLTATARFSKGIGNLRAVRYKRSAPTVTHALVQGNEVEAPATRTYVEVTDTTAAAAWWRVEDVIDGGADNDTNGELTQEGTAALAEGAAPVELATVTIDIDDLRAGVDFDLGDRVTIALPTGLEVADLVRSIHLQATPGSGEHVTSLIGSPEATTDPAMVRLMRDLARRLGRLEAR